MSNKNLIPQSRQTHDLRTLEQNKLFSKLIARTLIKIIVTQYKLSQRTHFIMEIDTDTGLLQT